MALRDGRGFDDRRDAGRHLGEVLEGVDLENPLVLGLPRGGVPVAREVAASLGAELDVCLVRKLGAPNQPEFGVGAVGEGGALVLDADSIRELGITDEELGRMIERERREVERQRQVFRPGRGPLRVHGRDVIVVDDGVATGVTAGAAAEVLARRGARQVIGAFPVAPAESLARLGDGPFDRTICLLVPEPFRGVGVWYRDFRPVSDQEVAAMLGAGADGIRASKGVDREVLIPTSDGRMLPGDLSVPPGARGIVVFVHGSGSSRNSPRNLEVARRFRGDGFGTLLFDLLAVDEEGDRARVFDTRLLTERLLGATQWLAGEPEVGGLPLGLFGASTGAAAAIRAAALLGTDRVFGLVSRGGRPDLAGKALAGLEVPILLLVGGNDRPVLELNREAVRSIPGRAALEVIPGAGHLFEERGALDQVVSLSSLWFSDTLAEWYALRAADFEAA